MLRSNNGFIRSLFLDGEGDASGGAAGGAPETFQLQHGDQTIDVPMTAIKPIVDKYVGDKYIPKASHNDQMARMRKEVDGYKTRPTADELLENPDFKTKAVAAWGMDPKATNKEMQEQREKLRLEMIEREVKPRDAKLSASDVRIKALQLKDLRGQIAQAASAIKVDDRFMKAPGKNAKPLIVSMMEDGFEYDDEHQEWFAKGSQGNKFAFSQSGDVPYMTVNEFFSVWANGEGKDFLRNEKQAGAEANVNKGDGAGQVGKELRLTADQIRDITYYRTMVAKAAKEGLTIVPV